jgi:hypothetical protein
LSALRAVQAGEVDEGLVDVDGGTVHEAKPPQTLLTSAAAAGAPTRLHTLAVDRSVPWREAAALIAAERDRPADAADTAAGMAQAGAVGRSGSWACTSRRVTLQERCCHLVSVLRKWRRSEQSRCVRVGDARSATLQACGS